MIEPATGVFDQDARNDPHLAQFERVRDSLNTAEWRAGLKELEGLARSGSIMSILLIADLMRFGRRYDRDLSNAEAWYRVAAEAGSANGRFGLGLTYRDMGRFEDAIRELEVATAKNYPPAFNALAIMCFRGEGAPVDRLKALDLWLRGASLGHIPSKKNLMLQSMHGGYGLWRRILSMLNILPVAIETVRERAKNPYSDRLR